VGGVSSRKKLNISWDDGPNETYDSDAYKKELRETAHNPGRWCAILEMRMACSPKP